MARECSNIYNKKVEGNIIAYQRYILAEKLNTNTTKHIYIDIPQEKVLPA